jgi:putative endonuclease
MWYLYILRCADDSLYTGITTDVSRRIAEHNRGKGAKYTKMHAPVALAYQETHPNRSKATKRESQIKTWPKKRKLALISQA